MNLEAVDGYSDTVTLPTTLNGQTSVLAADRVIAPTVSIGNPMVISAYLNLPAFTVPEGSSGEIVIEAPANDTVSSPRPEIGPAYVAFTAMATVYSQEGSQTIGMFCWDTIGLDRTLVRIPITPTAAEAPTVETGGTPAATTPGSPQPGAIEERPVPQVAAAASGEAESVAKNNARTFRVDAAAETGQHTDVTSIVIMALGIVAVLAALSALLGWFRLRVVRKTMQ